MSALDAATEFLGGRESVVDQSAADFLHGNPLEFMRALLELPIESGQGPTAQLLRALCRYVHEKKSAGDWGRGLGSLQRGRFLKI